jgi:hypothetical protein
VRWLPFRSVFFFSFYFLIPAGALVKFLHVVDGIYLCARFHFGPTAKGLTIIPGVVGSSFATSVLSGAWLVVGVNGDGQLP